MTDVIDTSKNLAQFRSKQPNGRCYENHPALNIAGHLIYGGSCGYPMVTNADVYVAFDYPPKWFDKAVFPWSEQAGPVCVPFKIMDMHAPDDPVEFKKMIDWLAVQLTAQKIVHMGCIGGHGRTGLVLAALVAKMMPDEPDAIGYVRKNYCQKAVESMSQVKFLQEHFGVKEAQPAKMSSMHAHGSDDWYKQKGYPVNGHGKAATSSKRAGTTSSTNQAMAALNRTPVKDFTCAPLAKTALSLWGETSKFDPISFGEPKNVVQ